MAHRFLALILIVSSSLFLAACDTQVASNNWPGMTADDNTVFVAYGPGVIAVDVAEQDQLWSFPAENNPTLQFYAPPAVAEERIIIGDYGASGGFFSPEVKVTLYALSRESGSNPEAIWTTDDLASDKIVAAPLLAGEKVYVGTSDNFVIALDASSQELLWRFEAGHSIWAQPVLHEDVLYVASLDKNLYALSADSGEELWRQTFDGAIASQPVIGDGLLYVGSFDNRLHALDLETGDERWSAEAENWVWASPAIAGESVIFADISGNVYAVSAEAGEMVWSSQVPGAIQATPVVVGNTVFIASVGDEISGQGTVMALSIADGETVWQAETPGPLYSTPVIANDSLVVASQGSEVLLYVFNLETGDRQWEFAPASAG